MPNPGDGEYPPDGKGGYSNKYLGLNSGNLNCTNPLYAKTLPTAPNGDVGELGNPQWTPGNPPPDPNNGPVQSSRSAAEKPSLIYYARTSEGCRTSFCRSIRR